MDSQLRRRYRNFQNMKPTKTFSVGGRCYGIAVHDDGTIYATNYDENIIKVFRPDDTEGAIGTSDDKKEKLSKPWGIGLIGDIIYVASSDDRKVQIYNRDGSYCSQIICYESNPLVKPCGVCTDGKEKVLVADLGDESIHMFVKQTDSYLTHYKASFPCSTQPGIKSLSQPYDIAEGLNGDIFVVLAPWRSNPGGIAMYSKNDDGTLRRDLILADQKWLKPTGIYIDGEGNKLIATENNGVHIFDLTNALIASRPGNELWGVAMDKYGGIYVTENNTKQVLLFWSPV